MPITDAEANEVYQYLAALLIEHKLAWVVDDVEATIALGKVATKQIPTEETQRLPRRSIRNPEGMEDLFPARYVSSEKELRRTKGAPATFTVSEEYTTKEKLELLVDSVILVVPRLNEVAEEVTTFFEGQISDGGAVAFEPEGGVERGFTLASSEVVAHREAAQRLESLLSEIKKEL